MRASPSELSDLALASGLIGSILVETGRHELGPELPAGARVRVVGVVGVVGTILKVISA